MMIVNDNSRVINKVEAWLTDDTRVVIYDRHMFIVQATGVSVWKKFKVNLQMNQNKLGRIVWNHAQDDTT